MAERHFTPAEVEALIPRLTAIMDRVMRANSEAATRGERLRAARQRIELSGGGVIDRAAWREDEAALARATEVMREGLGEIAALGGVPKDLATGLVDFPHARGGRTVNLCWKYGEQEIRFWHGLDEGFAALEVSLMPYAAILFDLFDTLVLFDASRMPLVEIQGKRVHTSASLLHRRLAEDAPGITLEACYGALGESWREAERLRALDFREVPAPARFRDFLRRLGLDPDTAPPRLIQDLIDTHRGALGHAAEFPPHHGPLLRRLGERARLAVVSNFDYSPTARDILERAGVADLFQTVVVSDAVGWRKPHPEIFSRALADLGVLPAEALFVGDRADIDVVGAQRMGIPSVWINRQAQALPPGIAPPDYEVRDLAELTGIVSGTD